VNAVPPAPLWDLCLENLPPLLLPLALPGFLLLQQQQQQQIAARQPPAGIQGANMLTTRAIMIKTPWKTNIKHGHKPIVPAIKIRLIVM